jgi:hypothetical protein
MRQGPVPASGGARRGRRELAQSPSLAGGAARDRRAGRDAERRGRAPPTVPPERRPRDRTHRQLGRLQVASDERPLSIRPHGEPARSGCRPLPRNDRQATGVFGRFGRGHHGLLAPRRPSGSGRCRWRRSGCGRQRRGLLDTWQGRRRLRLHRRRRRGGGGRGNHDPRALGQERERVEVALLVDGAPHAQVHVRVARRCVGALADRAEARTLSHLVATLDCDRAELQQRHGVAVARADRQRATSRRNGAGEGDGPCHGCAHRLADDAAHVDPAMLPCGVRVRPEDERSQHRPVDRPRPRLCAARKQQRAQRARDDREPTHRRTSFVVGGVNDRASNVAAASAVVTGDDANVERS